MWPQRGEQACSGGCGGAWLLSERLRGGLGEIRSCAGRAAETTGPAQPGQGTEAQKERAAGSGSGHGQEGTETLAWGSEPRRSRDRGLSLWLRRNWGRQGHAGQTRPVVPTGHQWSDICWARARVHRLWTPVPGRPVQFRGRDPEQAWLSACCGKKLSWSWLCGGTQFPHL